MLEEKNNSVLIIYMFNLKVIFMKRKIDFLVLAMLFSVMSFAQHPSVQGIPHSQVKSGVKSEPAVVYPNIDFDMVTYWVGEGDSISALVFKWDDGKGGNKNLVWGYRWSDEADGTGEAMLRAVAKEDPRFYMLVYGNSQYGAAIGGIGYDLNGNGNISLIKNGTSYALTDGICNTAEYDFDSWTSNDTQDHWCAGWYDGYWSYWVTDDIDNAYSYSGLGASSRKLSDGCIDGWSFMSDMDVWYSNDMSGEVEYVTMPFGVATSMPARVDEEPTEPVTYNTARSWESFLADVEKAKDGDIVSFAPGMRNEVLNYVGTIEINKSLTLIGNGVVTDAYFYCPQSSQSVIIKDFVFRGADNQAINAQDINLTVENCTFENIQSASDGTAVGYSRFKTGFDTNVLISGCRFSGNKNTKSTKTGTLYIKDMPQGKSVNANIVSCTFEGNEAGNGSGLTIANCPEVHFVNCVFEGNTSTKDGGVTIQIKRGDSASDVKSLGYNVIEGTLTATTDSRLQETDIIGEELEPILSLQDGEYYVIKGGLAYNHLPANTVIEGISWPNTDIKGLSVDYTKATHSGACQLVYDEAQPLVDYTKGTFIVNEDWYGHQNSTVNFLTDEGEWIYRVVQKENPGVELGCTNQYGTIYGDKFYFIAKQAKDPGASITGGRITVCDAKTMKVLKQIENIAVDDKGKSVADGRGFLGVDEHKGYVGTSNGIYILDLDKLEITGSVSGTGNDSDDPYQQLYGGQIGNMVRVNDRVFAVHQKNGLLVINPATDEVEQAVEAPEGWGFGSVVLSKDGNLWLSLAASSGSGQADTCIVRLNPATLEQSIIECPDGIFGPANSWYAWTPDCFCASKQNNVLYWNGGNSSWFSGKTIYKYDIDSNTFSTFIDYNNDPDGWQIYGCSFRVNPVTDEAIVSLYKGYGDPTYVVRKYNNEGNQTAEYSMISNYWFPSLPVFPDNEAPVVADISPVSITTEDSTTVSLKDVATDADNMDAAIVKIVKKVSDEKVLKAEMADGDLVITPFKAGKADITIQINSNGKLAETVVSVEISEATDIDAVEGAKAEEVGRYTLDGKMLNAPQRGINIIRMSDGTIKKVIVR